MVSRSSLVVTVIITQRLLISFVISPKGLNMRSLVRLKRTREKGAKKLVMSICSGARSTSDSGT